MVRLSPSASARLAYEWRKSCIRTSLRPARARRTPRAYPQRGGHPRQHPLQCRCHRDHARTRLGVLQPQLPRRPVHVVPTQGHDLVVPAPTRSASRYGSPRWQGADRAIRLRRGQHPTQTAILLHRQKPLPPVVPVLAHRLARVRPGRH